MKLSDVKVYRCPVCHSPFSLKTENDKEWIDEGVLICSKNHSFNIKEGIPDFTWPKELANVDQETKDLYNKLASEYDKFASIPFQTFYQDENVVRDKMTDRLNLTPDSLVLEIGGGDGRGAEHLVKRLQKNGHLYFQELSPSFMGKAIERL